MHNLLKFEKFKECDIQSSTFISEGHLYVHYYYYYYYYYYECLSPINDSSGEMYPFKLGRSAVRIAISMQASGLTFDFTGSQFRSFFCRNPRSYFVSTRACPENQEEILFVISILSCGNLRRDQLHFAKHFKLPQSYKSLPVLPNILWNKELKHY
jgi:hypothetical protein